MAAVLSGVALSMQSGCYINRMRVLAFACLASCSVPVTAQGPTLTDPAAGSETMEMNAAQLFALGDRAAASGDYVLAETAYRALMQDPAQEMRNEARFRLALMLADKLERQRDAAVLLRAILDEQPEMGRVRVELARVLAQMGDLDAAERELRAAQATDLPPEVERMVRFFANGLASRSRPFGLDFEVALAPDTNINRATTSDTLGTIIGDFDLSDDAKAKSGLGLAARARAYARIPTDDNATLLLGVNGSARVYRDGQFNDFIAGVQGGSQLQSGRDRIDVQGVANWRWFGGDLYTISYGVTGTMRHPLSDTAQLRLSAGLIYSDDRMNDLRDAERASISAGVDSAFSVNSGGGVSLSASRDFARDPGYATAAGGIDAYVYREFGRTTAVLRAGYDRLEADQRLFLYPERRKDDRFSAELSGTFRALKVGTIAPQVKLGFERSLSTIEIYDYQRLSAELGIVGAF